MDESTVLHHADGKTATVNLVRYGDGVVSIMTNGKVDGAVQLRPQAPVSTDELTMTLVGALALATHADARRIAIIGFGAGMTTHTVLGSARVERVDTIEIEPQMTIAAKHFQSRVFRAFDDPRAHIVYDDARSFFSAQPSRYDLIISEPSNLWVSGIAALFTEEFYARARKSLAQNGRFVQWIHSLEMSLPLLSSIINALGNTFEDYALYNLNGRELLIIAGRQGEVGLDAEAVLRSAGLRTELHRVGARTTRDLNIRRLGSRRTLEPLFASYAMVSNTDYFPVLDTGAVRARYLQENATELFALRRAAVPMLDMLEPAIADRRQGPLTVIEQFEQSQAVDVALRFAASMHQPHDTWLGTMPPWAETLRIQAELVWNVCGWGAHAGAWQALTLAVSSTLLPMLDEHNAEQIISAAKGADCDAHRTLLQMVQLELMLAVTERDAHKMTAFALQGLGQQGVSGPLRLYLLKAAMLGMLANDKAEQARELFEHMIGTPPQAVADVELRLLLTLALSRSNHPNG